MPTFDVATIPKAEVEALDSFAHSTAGPELHDLIDAIIECIGHGASAISLDVENAELTPNQAAARLGMSRTHLYKLLDSGEIPSHRVGRDRRIRVIDLAEFESQRQRDRRELTERFANREQTRQGAIDDVADLL